MRFDNQKVSEKMDKIITAERPSMMHKEGGGVVQEQDGSY